MKVRVYETVDIDTEVNVCVADVLSALTTEMEAANDGDKYTVSRFLSSFFQCLRSLSADAIERLTPKQRDLVVAELGRQADRFRYPVPLEEPNPCL